jgi:GT2 family glycosyltransferase
MFCILIPTINRKDLLMGALENYVTSYPNTKIYIVDNGHQDIPRLSTNVIISEMSENLGVSGSWNYLVKRAITDGFEHFLILNDDVILKKGEAVINGIIEQGGENTFHVCRPFYNWSSYILNKHIYQKVGEFDENFKKAFFEDNDYSYRMILAGVNYQFNDLLNPDVYLNSQTIAKDPSLSGYLVNEQYYIQKWGGKPSSETFKTPFNK